MPKRGIGSPYILMTNVIDDYDDRLKSREKDSAEKIKKLAKSLEELNSLRDVGNLCIYATGSYGRLEASAYSDLDLFFVQTSDDKASSIGRIEQALLDADVIRLVRELGFPEFSRDGQFLQVHQLAAILENLGGQEDDFRNYFTARLLLLLESRPLYAVPVYERALKRLVEAYYRDYQDHEKDFRPVFLANDIVRFWKTLCLNYEHRRNRQTDDQVIRAKSHLKNFRLKFSRLLTCYSALAWIASKETGPGPEGIFEMVSLTPTGRLRALRGFDSKAESYVASALEQYTWFLDAIAHSESDLLAWIRIPENRDQAFTKGRQFGEDMCNLILHLAAGKPFLRYLIV
jgi:predicted nucleotidyltransferase